MEADEGDKTPNLPLPSTNAETLIPETTLDRDLDPHANAPHDALESDAPGPIPPSSFPRDIFRALEVVERDSTAIAESFTSLFSSLRLALSEHTDAGGAHFSVVEAVHLVGPILDSLLLETLSNFPWHRIIDLQMDKSQVLLAVGCNGKYLLIRWLRLFDGGDSLSIIHLFKGPPDDSLDHLSVTGTSIEHMHCFNDAAGRLQESALDAATKGNRYINSCLRLNQDMKGIESLAMQLKMLKRNVDALDLAVNRIVRFP